MIELKSGLSGHVWLRKGRDIKEMIGIADFPNLILNTGLRHMGVSSDYLTYCNIGSDNTPPDPLQSSLINRIRGSNSSTPGAENSGVNVEDPQNPYVFKRVGIRFSPAGSSYNLSEISFGWNSSGSGCFNRALVRDPWGEPTTISILGDEFLDVIYELRIYPPMDDITGVFEPTGEDPRPRSYIVRARGEGGSLTYNNAAGWFVAQMLTSRGNNWDSVHSGDIGPIFSAPSGSEYRLNGTFAMDAAGASGVYALQVPLSSANWPEGIRSVVAAILSCKYQFQFDPPFPKTSDDVFTFSFRHSWGRREDI